MSEVKFYGVAGDYGRFSNFAPFIIFVDGKPWATAEHYFQASKMLKSLRHKFRQHPSLRSDLLSTGRPTIIEHTTSGSYWGDGRDGSGKNMLGNLLMIVRDEMKSINEDPIIVLPPWIAFPKIVQEDMFWRMGLGENYMWKWSRYYLSCVKSTQLHVK